MTVTSKTRLRQSAAVAVCLAALLVAVKEGCRDAAPSAISQEKHVCAAHETGPAAITARFETKADLPPAGASLVSAPVRETLPVSRILPQLGGVVNDWRTYRPERMMIAPYADLSLEFQMTSVREENGRTIWRGRNALTGALLVSVASENDWHAVLDIPAANTFEFHVSGQHASVEEKSGATQCGESPVAVAKADLAEEIEELAAKAASAAGDESGTLIDRVDVLFFYDAATFEANGRSRSKIETSIAARVEAANLCLENSQVGSYRWRYIAAYQVPTYAASGKLADDLGAITFQGTVAGDFVFEKCNLHGADQAMILVSGQRDYAGLAWVPAGGDMVAHHAAVTWDSSYVTLAHELAHNFGCRHDRRSENASDADNQTAYGFRFDYRGEDTGTIMSYASNRVPYFSNPDVSYDGIPLGVASGQPGAANNARLLLQKAGMMALTRHPCLMPVITEQPQGGTVPRGSNLALRVSAVGEQLTFQWRKNGAPISGATSATYSKTAAGDDDAGNYDVLVANGSGEAVSASAAVAVAATAGDSGPSTATTGQSQAQGSGGGGAPGILYLAALAVLTAVRSFNRRG